MGTAVTYDEPEGKEFGEDDGDIEGLEIRHLDDLA
jgi:hypothetical protein